jgi:4-hydroxythreonine-4-phosphate dehydrogenase
LKPLLLTSGEPAGVGPDLCLALAEQSLPIVIVADKNMLKARAQKLGIVFDFQEYQPSCQQQANKPTILHIPCDATVIPGKLNSSNASYVIKMLTTAVDRCLQGEFSALVTAPVHKAIINDAGYKFTGHTEFLAQHCQVDTVVMMLACEKMKVALVTTHLPLQKVAHVINENLLLEVVTCLEKALKRDFAIKNPQIYVAGLNPHAGENGYLGKEEIEVIIPSLQKLKQKGIAVHGPFPADTMFTQYEHYCDVFLAMYHDQGLPVLKYAGFGKAANITLGLPIIRTSVDHGTALDLAGTGKAELGSLLTAVQMAITMVKRKSSNEHY